MSYRNPDPVEAIGYIMVGFALVLLGALLILVLRN